MTGRPRRLPLPVPYLYCRIARIPTKLGLAIGKHTMSGGESLFNFARMEGRIVTWTPKGEWSGETIRQLPDCGHFTPSTRLFVPVGDAASREIIGRHLDAHTVSNQNANSILAHLAGNCCQNDMFRVVQLDLEECVGLLIYDSALRGNQIISCQ